MALDTINQHVKPSIVTGLTGTGTTQATAYPLAHNGNHRFDTVPTNSGAMLPIPEIPEEVAVYNNGANSLTVYPPPGGAINGGTVNAGVALTPGSAITYWAGENSGWWTKTTGGGGGSSTTSIRTFNWFLGVTTNGIANSVVVATNPSNVYLICSKAGTFTRVDLFAGTGPTGAALIVDIQKSSNQGVSFASIFSGTFPQIAAGAVSGSQTSFGTTSYSAGDILQLNVTQVGSSVAGNNVTVTLDTAMNT